MSDPQPEHLKPRPRRAEPIQPDLPGSGAGVQPSPGKSADELEDAAALKSREQAQTALDNAREGYG